MSKSKRKHRGVPPPRARPRSGPPQSGNGRLAVTAEAWQAWQAGRALREQGRLAEAVAALEAAVAADPNFADAPNDLGDCYLRQGRLVEAQTAFQTALSKNPRHAMALNNLGALSARTGNLDQAARYFEQALAIEPDNAFAQANLATARREAETRRVFTFDGQAASPGPTISLCLIAKNEARNLPRLLESLRGAVDEIVLVDTGSTDDTLPLAQSFGAKVYHFPWRDDFAAAKNEALRRANGRWILTLDADMEAEPGHAAKIRQAAASGLSRAYYLNVRSPREDGMTVETVAHPWLFENTPGVEFAGRVHEAVFPSLMAHGMTPLKTDINITHFGYQVESELAARGQRDLRILEAAARNGQGDALTDFYLARAYTRAGRMAAAQEKLEAVVAAPDVNWRLRANAYALLMRVSLQVEGREAALRRIEAALRLFPEDRQTWTAAAGTYSQLGEVERAAECLRRALALPHYHASEAVVLERSDEELTFELGQCLAYLKRWPEAVEHFRRALDAGLRTAAVYCSLGLTYSLMGDHARAETALQAAVELNPASPEARRQLGFLYAETNRPAAALPELALAVAGGRGDEELLDVMETLAAVVGDRDAVRRACERAAANGRASDAVRARLDQPPLDPAARAQELAARAQVLYRGGKWRESLVKYEQALTLAPEAANWRNEMGAGLAALGEGALAARAFQAELAVNPTNDQALYNLGVLLSQAGESAQAAACFRLALTINPDNAGARRRLAESLPLLYPRNSSSPAACR